MGASFLPGEGVRAVVVVVVVVVVVSVMMVMVVCGELTKTEC